MNRCAQVAAIVMAGALAACGSGSGEADEPEGLGPLAELMGWQAEEPAEMRRKELAREEAVAECMREEGWEYQPVDWSAQMPEAGAEDIELMDDPEAYGEKYGYGVVRNYELYEEEGLLSGETDGGMGMEFEDPNQDYVESLSPSEMDDYYATLQGDPEIWGEPSEDETFVSPPLEDQGCYGRAQLEVYGDDPMSSDPELQERMGDFWEGQQSDPRVEQAAADWVECMGDTIAGVEVLFEPIDHPDDMYQYVDQLKMEAMGLEAEPFDDSDPDAWSEDVYTVMSVGADPDSPQVAYVGQPEAIPEAELEELRAREIELWKRDHDCQDDSDFADARRRMEEEFVEELRADFPELADAGDDAGNEDP